MQPRLLSLERLFRLRLVIARLGEMDNAGWWNTTNLLGSAGTFVMKRGFPRTYPFVQARTSFAVATNQCQAIIALPHGATLWRLPAEIEDAFADQWQTWIDNAERWLPFFIEVAAIQSQDVLGTLSALNLTTDDDIRAVRRLKNATVGFSVEIPSAALDDPTITLLAAGFAYSEPGKPIVPYMRGEG